MSLIDRVVDRISTKDVLAVMVVGAALVFNAISMLTGKPLDAGTIGMAGIIVGHYFGKGTGVSSEASDGPLPEPYAGDDGE